MTNPSKRTPCDGKRKLEAGVKLWQLTTRPRSLHGIICAGVWTGKRVIIRDAAPVYAWAVGRPLIEVMSELYWSGQFVWCECLDRIDCPDADWRPGVQLDLFDERRM